MSQQQQIWKFFLIKFKMCVSLWVIENGRAHSPSASYLLFPQITKSSTPWVIVYYNILLIFCCYFLATIGGNFPFFLASLHHLIFVCVEEARDFSCCLCCWKSIIQPLTDPHVVLVARSIIIWLWFLWQNIEGNSVTWKCVISYQKPQPNRRPFFSYIHNTHNIFARNSAGGGRRGRSWIVVAF